MKQFFLNIWNTVMCGAKERAARVIGVIAPGNALARAVLVATLVALAQSPAHAAITYVASASNPADDASLDLTTVAVTPPGGMVSGDLVVLIANAREAAMAMSISADGGQTWTAQAANTTRTSTQIFWARYNGSWSADPSVTFPGAANSTTVVMHVFRPSSSANFWALDVAQVNADYPAPGGADNVTITGISTITDGALVLALWASTDNNTWALQTGGWANAGLTQYRNRDGSDASQSTAYKVMPVFGASGNVTNRQTANGGDQGNTSILAFKEIPSTTLASGTDPAATTIAPGAAATDVNLFTLQTSAGTEAVTSVTVNLSTNSGIALLAITNNTNTVLGSTASPVAGANVIPVAGLTANTSATSFKVRVTPMSHAAMPAPPGAAYAITAPVTAWAGPNPHAGSDTNVNALTIDNLSPTGATATSGVAGYLQNTLSWTTSVSADFATTAGSVLYRWAAGSAGAEVPVEGSTPVFGATNGTATVACVVTSAGSTALSRIDGPGSSSGECTTVALTAGQAYSYKVFQKDSRGNYGTGVSIGTFTPHGAVSAATSTVVAVPTSIEANGYTTSTITVTLKDGSSIPVPGKTVTLAKSAGSSIIAPASDVTNASGVASFTVKNSTTEGPITYTATDTTDAIIITQTAQVTFTAPSLCFTDDFNRATLLETLNWTRTKSAGTTYDAEIVNNRLRLTDNAAGRSTAVHLQRLFPGAGNKVIAEFDYYSYDGTSADGVVMALSDSSIAPVSGAFGGSLGYAQKCENGVSGCVSDCTTPGGCPGFAGGWLGVGMDEYGNFSNPTEGRVDGPGFQANSMTVRGSGSGQSGYNFHTRQGPLVPPVDLGSITHVGAGTSAAANGGNVTPGLPVHQTDDLLLCAVTSNDNTAHSVATSGWAQVYQIAQGGAGQPRSSLFYKKALSGAETAPTITHTGGGGIVAACTAFRGVDTTTPFDIAYTGTHYADTTNNSNVTSGSLTTVNSGATILFLGHVNNNRCNLSTSVTGGLAWNESFCADSTQGADELIAVHYAAQGSAGLIGPITFTHAGNDENRGVLVALRPVSATPHRYRVTVDHSNGSNAYVTVERDSTGLGTSYTTIVPTYDAKAIVTQAAVPPYWLFSFTGSTGGLANTHEIDNLTVCTDQPLVVPVLDHVRIVHDGAALTCAPEAITIKACADASCSALYTGSVTTDLTNIAGATWSLDPVTFSGGQTSVTLSKATTGTVTLGGAVTAPSAMAAVCYNGATSGDCSLTYSSNACAFDAVEVTQNPSTPIFTKLAGTPFSVDVLALTAGAINTGYTGTVTVDLVDQTGAAPGACGTTSLAVPTSPVSPYTFVGGDNGRRTFTFNYANAASDVRVRMVSGPTTACSSDNFAIRPTAFSISSPNANNSGISGTPTVKAGANFTLDANSLTGYTGTALINSNSNHIEAHAGAVQTGTLSGSFSAASLGTSWISRGTAFTYSEVGSFRLAPWGIYDDGSFATVDRSKPTPECFIDNKVGTVLDPANPNILDGNGKYGCYFGNTATTSYFGRFTPDHFAITPVSVVPGCGTFTYLGQDGFTTQFTLTAQNSGNATTLNYVGIGDASSWAKLPLTVWGAAPASAGSPGFGFSVSAWAPSQPAGAAIASSATSPTATNGNTWLAGTTTVTAKHRITRPTNPAVPTTTTVSSLPVDSDGVSIAAPVSIGMPAQRYGILRLENSYGSELLPIRVATRSLYCNAVGGATCTQWLTNTADSCTSFTPATGSLANYLAPATVTNPLATTNFRITGTDPNTASGSTGNWMAAANPTTLNQGIGNIILNRPCIGGPSPACTTAVGSVDLTLDLTTNLPWLLGTWTSAGTWNENPTARLKFGSPKAPYIYLRERY